jgi:osmotically-inducible protein OsmY
MSLSQSLGKVIPCILVLLLAGAILGGCKGLTAGVPRPARDDAALTAQVRTLITQDPELKDSQIRVFVLEGNVTLSGTVPDAGAKARLLDAVRDLRNVRSVGDNLEVRKTPG